MKLQKRSGLASVLAGESAFTAEEKKTSLRVQSMAPMSMYTGTVPDRCFYACARIWMHAYMRRPVYA